MADTLKAHSRRKISLFFGDIIVLISALWLTLFLRYQEQVTPSLFLEHLYPFLAIFFVMLIAFYIDELYELTTTAIQSEFFNRLFRTFIVTGLIGIAFFYIGDDRLFNIKPQRVFLIYLVTSALLLYTWRFIFYQITASDKIKSSVLIVGLTSTTQTIAEELLEKSSRNFTLHSIIATPDQKVDTPNTLSSHTVVAESITSLYEYCKQYHIDVIVSSESVKSDTALSKDIFNCISLDVTIYNAALFYEFLFGKIPVSSIEHTWFLENFNQRSKRGHDAFQRVSDVFLSIILLVISLPFLPFIAIIIKTTSKGPIIFKQTRTGKNGKTFLAMKFRSMIANAEKNGPQWATKNDSRITSFGAFMRKTRIDEIPQLFNILRGEMSLIGPRPERPEFITQLQETIPFYKERLLVKPGLTGWAQVVGPDYGGSVEETLEKLQYDLYYIKNRSLGLDASIILKTIKTVLSRKGH